MSSESKKIGLLSHLGHGNLGDDASFATAMQSIKERWPEAEFVGLSLNPSDTSERHGVPAYAIRRDSKRRPGAAGAAIREATPPSFRKRMKDSLMKLRALAPALRAAKAVVVSAPKSAAQEFKFFVESVSVARSLDLLVISGGGQLLDCWNGGPWGFPWTLCKWIVLAKVFGARCYVINVGAGPVEHALSRWFYRVALRLSDDVSFRDSASEKLIRETGICKRGGVAVDIVYGLEPPVSLHRLVKKRSALNVGFSPMAYCDPARYWDKNLSAYDSFLGKCGRFGKSLIESERELTLFSTDIWFDAAALDCVEAAAGSGLSAGDRAAKLSRPRVEGIQDLLDVMTSLDCVLTCRYHGVVFAHLTNTPVIALSHHPKVVGLMREIGLGDYCLDIRDFEVETLQATFERLEKDLAAIRRQMAETLPMRRQTIQRQFDALFPRHGRGVACVVLEQEEQVLVAD